MATTINWITGLLAVLGGGAGIATAVNAFLSHRKIRAEAGKTNMDAAAVMSEQVLKFMEAASNSVKEMQSQVVEMKRAVKDAESASRKAEEALHEARSEIGKLRRHIETLNHLLSSHGIPAPPLPVPTPNGGKH